MKGIKKKPALKVIIVLLIISAVLLSGYFCYTVINSMLRPSKSGVISKIGNIIEVLSEPAESHEVAVLKTMPDYLDGNQWVFGFRDFTVYGEYKYSDLTEYFNSEDNVYFKPAGEDDRTEIRKFLSEYENHVATTKDSDGTFGNDITKVYRFERDMMDDSDWYYLEKSSENDKTVYYYDAQSLVLYLMHYDI